MMEEPSRVIENDNDNLLQATTSADKSGSPTTATRQSGATHKMCAKCSKKVLISAFPIHSRETGERGAYCRECKNALSKERRLVDAAARLRHYTVTRIKNEWPKEKIPKDIHTGLEDYLGYKLFELKKHLRTDCQERLGISLIKAFKEGYHLDHIKPHKLFPMGTIGDADFKACWAISNLRMIPSLENLQKGAKTDFYTKDAEDDNDDSE